MPLKRTTIRLSPHLWNEAKALARERGVSFAELVREALEKELARHRSKGERHDPFFDNPAVYRGPVPKEYSRDHDRHLYDR